MSRLCSMSVPIGETVHEVDYQVTHEGCGPSGEVFDGTADPGEPMECYVVTVGDVQAKDVDLKLLESIEDYIHEHHESDDDGGPWFDGEGWN